MLSFFLGFLFVRETKQLTLEELDQVTLILPFSLATFTHFSGLLRPVDNFQRVQYQEGDAVLLQAILHVQSKSYARTSVLRGEGYAIIIGRAMSKVSRRQGFADERRGRVEIDGAGRSRRNARARAYTKETKLSLRTDKTVFIVVCRHHSMISTAVCTSTRTVRVY